MSAPSAASSSQSTILRALVSASVAGFGIYLSYRFVTAPRSVRPGINTPFADSHTPSSDHANRFESESREVFAKCQTVVNALQIAPGARIADVGCGSGIFLTPLAKAVGTTGHVYGYDAFPKMVQHLKQKVETMPAEQKQVVTIHQNTEHDLGNDVEKHSLDLVIAIDTYHHFEYPMDILKSIYAKLKPSGRLLIVDFNKREGISSEWIMGHVRQTREICVKEVTSCGFVLEKDLTQEVGLDENYALVFKKEMF